MYKVTDSYKRHILVIVLGPFIKLIEAVFDLLIPLFMKAVIDLNQYHEASLIPNKFSRNLSAFIRSFGTWIPNNQPLNDAIIGMTIILVMGVVGFCFTMISQYLAAKAATDIGKEVREELFNKIIHLSKKDREQFSNGRLMTSLSSDTYQLQQGILFFVRLAVRAPFIIIGSLTFSFILDWKIGLAFTAIVPILFIVFFVILYKSSKEYRNIQSTLDNVSTKTSDTLYGARVIRAFNQQEKEIESFDVGTTEYKNRSIKVHKLNSIINPFVFALTALVTILIVFLLRDSLLHGTDNEKVIISSTIIAEMAYLAQIFFATTQLPPVLLDILKAGVSRRRIDQILLIEPSIVSDDQVGDSNTIVEFRNVYFSYKEKSEHYALKDISFTLKKGETLGVIGGTGSGKTTFINLIERFFDANKGEVLYKGINIKQYDLKVLRKEIGLVNQKSTLFKGTIKSNFLMSNPSIKDEDIIQALKDAEAYEFVKEYKDKINHEVNEGGTNFSGGQRQRLCIARTLAKNPSLLILDDSTSALDLLTDKKVRTTLSSKDDLTKIIVSQRIATIKDADKIILLDKGRIVGFGKHKDLLKDSSIYQEIYESQTKKGEYE